MKDIEKEKFLKKIGILIKEKREKLGLSQEDFAEISGFHRTYISLIERGKRNISIYSLKKICNSLNIPLEDFLKEVGQRSEK